MRAEEVGVVVVPGMSWWHLVVAIVAGMFAYDLLWQLWDGLVAAVQRLVRWWQSRPPTAVEDATADPEAPPEDPPIRRGDFVPAKPPPPTAEQRRAIAPYWETKHAVHRAECPVAQYGSPLQFILTRDELADELPLMGKDKRACRHCDPLEERDREDTGEQVAVSSS